MAGLEYVTARQNGQQTCIDLRATGSPRETFENETWRGCVLHETGSSVTFILPNKEITCDQSGNRVTPSIDAREHAGADSTTGTSFYTPSSLQELIRRENQNSLDLLVAQLRSPMGVVPFVGAGLSINFGFPGWAKFLSEAADFHSEPDKVLVEIDNGRLIEAATLLYTESPDRFQRLVEKSYGGPVPEDQARVGPAGLLPGLGTGPVITTNFDHVLETAFLAAGSPFENILTGREADSVVRAMHRNEHVLVKLHGDAADRSARVFTGFEYDGSYGSAEPDPKKPATASIPSLARVLFTNRPLLFLGSSLERDRTLGVLAELHKELPALTHYAVLAGSYSVERTRKRRLELDEFGISPLWYPPGDYGSIEAILEDLLWEASTRLLWRPSTRTVPGRQAASPKERVATVTLGPAPSGAAASVIRRLARRIVTGRLVFFIGAGAHLDPSLSAVEHYRALAQDYGFDETHSQRAEVAQFIVDREGKAEAWAAAREKLPCEGSQASIVLRFLAELPGLLRDGGKRDAAPQCYLTSNFDTMLENVLAGEGEAFHLLYYQADGRDEGRFVHRDPGGSIRVIERPQSVHSFCGGASLVVKTDGGIPWDRRLPETVALSPMDFAVSAGRLPTALPEAVRRAISERSTLVLGSSLRDAHIQRFIRWAAGTKRQIKTWAVLREPPPAAVAYWSAAGVEIVDCDLVPFTVGLRSAVCEMLGEAHDSGMAAAVD